MIDGIVSGERLLDLWLFAFAAVGIGAGVVTGSFKARKIQPRGFKWKVFRNEIGFSAFNLTVTAFLLGPMNAYLKAHGYIKFHENSTYWWMIALEYVLYFLLFDTYFYWLHRWMHKEPFYTWVHKIHHRSTAPNMLTTLSVSPLESLINGGFVPLFLTVFTVHSTTMWLLAPTNIIMGLYVHSGYEFMPRWWNRSWGTKWFITATFHDQHHRYFTGNFGGYTTIWDRLCGTIRKKYEADFESIKDRAALGRGLNALPITEIAEVE